ncbi:cell wall-binding repeat-containing protein [Agromyces sp. SYSU K20354]|uniref:cell wall-binding repeat-containing protein n=1 Tax=Agromyces cavernae TaxID=2898659 RepID=UPI001E5D04A8|nr:cell wall-binding repeat-containing protein [Agromyces cavernae]MCD2441720.1 cell wall-binding repeat-containing protein [Agromyces cavernae]
MSAIAAGTGSISGKVTLSDGRPLSGGRVWAWDRAKVSPVTARTASDGSYSITGLAPGSYTLEFSLGDRTDLVDYVPEYWKDTYFQSKATSFSLAAGQALTGMNAQLALGSTVSGKVLGPDGKPPARADVDVVALDGETLDLDNTVGNVAADGTFTIRGIPAGTWTLLFWGRSPTGEPYVIEYWGDRPYRSQATRITFTAGSMHTGMDAKLARGATISGRVTGPHGEPVAGADVNFESAHSWATGVAAQEADVGFHRTDEDGYYTIQGVPPGLWRLYFYPPEGSGLRIEWWSDRPWGNPNPIRVLPQATVTGRNAKLTYESKTHPWGNVSRIAGSDRYSTAARVSASEFAPGVPVAFIASGATFPDALSAAPVAATSGGPILLSPQNSLPDVVADELRRLKPKRIVVLGGTGAISAAVAIKLALLTPGSITRIGGADRYATSAALSKSRFAPGVPVAYLTSGSKFPDALSAAPHAALSDGPILLTGDGDRLPAAIVAELKRLKPESIEIIGGGVVGPNAHTQLNALVPGYTLGTHGRDRYETSALLSDWFDYGVSVAYVANGMEFPDALAGGPVAGISSGPVLLTSRDSLPKSVADALKRLRPDKIVILGGTGAVSAKVESQLKALSG